MLQQTIFKLFLSSRWILLITNNSSESITVIPSVQKAFTKKKKKPSSSIGAEDMVPFLHKLRSVSAYLYFGPDRVMTDLL